MVAMYRYCHSFYTMLSTVYSSLSGNTLQQGVKDIEQLDTFSAVGRRCVGAWCSLDATRLAAELLVLPAEHLGHVVAPRVLVAVLAACVQKHYTAVR